jgi:shikimate dehydrogenase
MLYNRSVAKGEALLREVASAFPKVSTMCVPGPSRDCDIAINATSVGLHPGDPLPFSVDALPPSAAVADVVMQPLITRLLREAGERGLAIVTGDGMLTRQLPIWMDFIGFDRTADPVSVAGSAATVEHSPMKG